MELAVKLESALVAHLRSLSPPWPDYFDSTAQILPGEAEEDIDNQYVRCRAADASEGEYPLDSGNFWWQCEVEVRTPALVDGAADTSQLEKHQSIAAIIEDALLVDDLPSSLNTAAAGLGAGYELTVMAVQSRQPSRSQSSDVYSSGWSLRVYCASTDIS